MDKVIYHARDLLEKKEDFVIAEVVDTTGSTPRKKGAWLLMRANGTRYGTVGGGKLEFEVEKKALEAFKTKESGIVHFSLTPEEQGGIDMRCGGDADVKISYIDASNPGEFTAEYDIDDIAYIFGGGHVGKAIEPILRYIGFKTVVLDDRSEYANRDRFPEASDVRVIGSYDTAFDGITTDEHSYIVIVTRGHAGDYDVVRKAITLPNAYVGMIGSRSKVAQSFKRLLEDGATQAQVNNIHSPIGLKIGAETPEEIAISVAAEIIAVRAGK